MADVPEFNVIFGSDPGLCYPQKVAEQIIQHRQKLDGKLFFDRLLQTMGLQDSIALHPPRSNKELRKLYSAIAESGSPAHHKQSLIYYILLNLSLPKRSAAQFARAALLPGKYATLMDGLWALDWLELDAAVASLSAPALLPTFVEETLAVLCRHANEADGQKAELVLGYYEIVGGAAAVSSQSVRDDVFRVMAGAGVSEAFFHARRQALPVHRHLFGVLVAFVLGELQGDRRAAAAAELVGLPLNTNEEAWLAGFLLEDDGAGNDLPGAKDTMVMRRLLKGDFDGARELGEQLGGERIDGVNWAGLMKTPS